jgi:hypothetical protein
MPLNTICLSVVFRRLNVQPLRPLMFAHCRVQIGRDKRKRALHVIDHIATAGIDVADQDPPTRVFAGIGGFPPEAQNENLIQQWSLSVHETTFAWRELGTMLQGFRDSRLTVTSGRRDNIGRMRPRSRQDHGVARRRRRFGPAPRSIGVCRGGRQSQGVAASA